MSRNPPAGTSFDTNTLLHHEHGGGAPGEDKVMIAWAVKSKAPLRTNTDLGTSAKKWAVSIALPDIKSSLVATINIEWGRSNTVPLLNEEVTFRWHGSRLLEPNTANMTLGQFYAYYSTASRAQIYLTGNIPTAWKATLKSTKGPAICLELYIDSKMVRTLFMSRTVNGAETASKRPGEILNHPSHARISNFSSAPMRSMFLPTSSIQVQQRFPVVLKKISCVADASTGEVQFQDMAETIHGTIANTQFAQGAMKSAYSLTTGSGLSLVVKRFYCITEVKEGAMIPPISIADNRKQIYLELQRLTIGAYFLKAFFRQAVRSGVTVYTAIKFADAWLGQELNRPSVASGSMKIDSSQEGITWLVEDKRATTVEHFTFTLNHQTRRRDLCAQTIHAFAHFVFGHSNKNVVFADIQGTPTHIDGQDMMVLFDPMTHTPTGDSGIGDFGREGIRTFIRDHECGDLCRSLGLDTSIILADDQEPATASAASPRSQSPDSDLESRVNELLGTESGIAGSAR
ncbi:kinase-like domain-containing protein [Mycena vitilis]|nr:kinase-like domain-containing protein [Mycena vitilis]KAJ6460796.1 kinase-like domain-containing protein [Mycena vitilis]